MDSSYTILVWVINALAMQQNGVNANMLHKTQKGNYAKYQLIWRHFQLSMFFYETIRNLNKLILCISLLQY